MSTDPARLAYRVISIGTLASHPLWEEAKDARTGHTTTTLIEAPGATIVVDPGLPAQALGARFAERTAVKPEAVTHVFLTAFTPDHARGANLFRNAAILLGENEREGAAHGLEARADRARETGDRDALELCERLLGIIEATQVAPDRLAPGVDLFPLPGVTPGTCGLILSEPTRTVLVCGDAVPTREHFERGAVLPGCADVDSAMESFREALSIADLIIPGRDEALLSPVGAWQRP